MSEELEFIELFNAVGGLILMFMAYGIYGFFRKTSLASPLRILGMAFFIFLFHEFVDVYGAAYGRQYGAFDLEQFYHFLEIAFAAIILVGLYTFKTQFEKFEWVREISATSEVIPQK